MNNLMPYKFESERLIIRIFNNDDWKDLHDYYSDIEATKYTFGRALTEGETWRTVASMVGHWFFKGYGPYALEDKESGKVIGVSGLWFPNDWPEPEIKWGLSKAFQGKGYASEAVRKVKDIAKESLPDLPLISLIHSENKPSIRLAIAIRANFEREILFRGGKWSIYRHS